MEGKDLRVFQASTGLVRDFTPHLPEAYSLLLEHANHSRSTAAVHS